MAAVNNFLLSRESFKQFIYPTVIGALVEESMLTMSMSVLVKHYFHNLIIVLRLFKLHQKPQKIFEDDKQQDEEEDDEELPAMLPERGFEQELYPHNLLYIQVVKVSHVNIVNDYIDD